MFYNYILKPFLFLFPPEKAHHLALRLLRIQIGFLKTFGLINVVYKKPASQNIPFCGLHFPNMLGLAAGFDKDAKYIDILQYLGFGFIEVGTVTPVGQEGNPMPRLFRLANDKAIINRMGFNNDGVDAMVERLKNFKNERDIIIGGNIGKNKLTPNENAVDDYILSFEKLFDYVDYFVVNVSSPNTPGLRNLQNKEPLKKLLQTVSDANQKKSNPKPILLKIAPDITEEQLDDIIDIFNELHIDGLILSNTTISREGLSVSSQAIQEIGNGGLSGLPLQNRALSLQKLFVEKSGGNIPFIAVGGIMDENSAANCVDNGANLIQMYTGFIYGGVKVVRDINKRLTP